MDVQRREEWVKKQLATQAEAEKTFKRLNARVLAREEEIAGESRSQ